MFLWTLFKRIVGIGFVVGGLVLWGMKGLLVGVVLSTWCTYLVNISLVSKHIGYKWWKQLLDLMPVTVVSFIAAVISYGCGYLLKLNMYPDGIVKLLVYSAIYLGWSFLAKPEAFVYFKSIINPMLSKIRKSKQKNNYK